MQASRISASCSSVWSRSRSRCCLNGFVPFHKACPENFRGLRTFPWRDCALMLEVPKLCVSDLFLWRACHTSEATKEGATITQRNDRITAATPTLTHLIWLSSISVQESVVFVPLFLPRLGMRPPPRENESFLAATGASFDSGKNNGGVAANVSCHLRLELMRALNHF